MLGRSLQIERAARQVFLGVDGSEGGSGVLVGDDFVGFVDHGEDEPFYSFLVGLDEGGHAAWMRGHLRYRLMAVRWWSFCAAWQVWSMRCWRR